MSLRASVLAWAAVTAVWITTAKSDSIEADQCDIGDSVSSPMLLQLQQREKQSGLNLCIENHLAPELFLIGAQKSATSCLSTELRLGSSSIITPVKQGITEGWGINQKEPHIFDFKFQEGKQVWLSRYPPCPSDRAVASDMTPMLHIHAVPGRIHQWYGQDAKRLTFVMLLRSPLHRMQSAFHHRQTVERGNGLEKRTLAMSFEEYVASALADPNYCQKRELADPTNEDVDAFCDSLYVPQLTEWFTHFSGSQFVVVPFKYVVARTNEETSVAEALFTRLGIPGKRMPLRAGHMGVVGKYSPMEEELSDDSLTQLEKLVSDRTGADKVAKLLVQHGANLYNFVGQTTGNEKAVADWLQANW